MKCEICKGTVQQHFLQKILGTYVKDAKGKKYVVCNNCQKLLKEKKVMLEKV